MTAKGESAFSLLVWDLVLIPKSISITSSTTPAVIAESATLKDGQYQDFTYHWIKSTTSP